MSDPARRSGAVLVATLLLCAPALSSPQDGGGPKPADGGAKPADGGKKPVDPPKPEEVKDFVKQYEENLKKMTEEDAIAGVGKLRGWYANPGTDEDSRKEILHAMAAVVELKTRESLVEAACKALGDFGEKGLGILKYVVNRGLGQKVPPQSIVRAGLASLGRIASTAKGDVKFLTDLIKAAKKEEKEFVVDAARALAGYARSPGEVRRDIFEEILKYAIGVFTKSEGTDKNAKQDWTTFGSDLVETMQKLSRKNFQKPPEFRDWMNDKSEKGGRNPKAWPDEPPPDPKAGGK